MNRPNPNARLWLFDFDNTLAALEREVDWPGSRRELEAFLREAGVDQRIFAEIPKGNLPLYAALHMRWLRVSSSDAIRSSVESVTLAHERPGQNNTAGHPPRPTAEALLRGASEIIERHELIGVERAQPTEGAIELLKALDARGSVVVIVTSNSSLTVARWLERQGISELVRAIVGRDSLLALKPSPEMVLRGLELGALPDRTARPASLHAHGVFVGDGCEDFGGGRRAVFAGDSEAAVFAGDSEAAVFVGDSEADGGAARAADLGFYGIANSRAARDRLVAVGAADVFTSPAALNVHIVRANRGMRSKID